MAQQDSKNTHLSDTATASNASNSSNSDMRQSGKQLPLPKARIVLLIIAALSMLVSVCGAIVRSNLQGSWLALPSPLPDMHGALMVFGFLGGAIGLERAVAWRAGSSTHPVWGFAVPLFAVLGTISVGVTTAIGRAPLGRASLIPGTLWTIALLILCAVYVGVWTRQRSHAVVIQFLGAAVGAAGAALWACGLDADILSPWWLMFLVLTIIGERLELAHAAFVGPLVRPALITATVATVLCLPVSLAWPLVGYPLLALCFAALLVLMFAYDTARKTWRAGGVTGFMGISMLSAYAWGLVACCIWLFVPYGGLGANGLWWDLAVHALALGFIMAMVVAHVCVIVPSIIRRAMPFHPVLWTPLCVFQLGLLLRALGTVRQEDHIWQLGDAITIVGMLTLMASVITMISLVTLRRRKRIASRTASQTQPQLQTHSLQQTQSKQQIDVKQKQQHQLQNKQQSIRSTILRPQPHDPFVPDLKRHTKRSASLPAAQTRGLAPLPYISAVVCIVLVATVGVIGTHPAWAMSADEISSDRAQQSASHADASSNSSDAASLSSAVTPTGHTTTVQIGVDGMAFTPNNIEVPAGDTLIIEFTNSGDQIHDLVLDNGVSSGRISAGKHTIMQVGVLSRSLEGWCSIAGHRQMGMTLHIEATGAPTDAASQTHTQHSNTTHMNGTTSGTTPSVSSADLAAQAKTEQAYHAAMPAYTGGDRNTTVRKATFDISKGMQQVTKNLSREVWMFGGSQPGPVLRGKVGDTFEITLVNNSDMDHSIDFHAGDDAVPNIAMTTIAPGKSFVYKFTAARSGIWMYHCSSSPMSLHIANGMTGAVIVEPAKPLPAVDAEYVLVESEQYLGADKSSADANKIATLNPDIVAFNGRAFQYDAHPLTMPADGTARFWVLNAGPNVPLSFHIVGAQFATVWTEGHYTVRNNTDVVTGEGPTGSQAVSFLPAQGGFVEVSIPKQGNYPIVNHVMSFAERGAHGMLQVR